MPDQPLVTPLVHETDGEKIVKNTKTQSYDFNDIDLDTGIEMMRWLEETIQNKENYDVSLRKKSMGSTDKYNASVEIRNDDSAAVAFDLKFYSAELAV